MPTDAFLYNATSGEEITDERFSVRLMDSALFITVQGVQVNDGGNYNITASNMFGNGSTHFLIETKGELGRGGERERSMCGGGREREKYVGGEREVGSMKERRKVDARERNHRG